MFEIVHFRFKNRFESDIVGISKDEDTQIKYINGMSKIADAKLQSAGFYNHLVARAVKKNSGECPARDRDGRRYVGSFFLVFGRDMKFNSKSLSSAPKPCFPAPLHGRAPAAVQGPQARAGSSEHAARAARAMLHLMQGDRLCAVHGGRVEAGCSG